MNVINPVLFFHTIDFKNTSGVPAVEVYDSSFLTRLKTCCTPVITIKNGHGDVFRIDKFTLQDFFIRNLDLKSDFDLAECSDEAIMKMIDDVSARSEAHWKKLDEAPLKVEEVPVEQVAESSSFEARAKAVMFFSTDPVVKLKDLYDTHLLFCNAIFQAEKSDDTRNAARVLVAAIIGVPELATRNYQKYAKEHKASIKIQTEGHADADGLRALFASLIEAGQPPKRSRR